MTFCARASRRYSSPTRYVIATVTRRTAPVSQSVLSKNARLRPNSDGVSFSPPPGVADPRRLFAPSLTVIVPALIPVESCRREIISASMGTSTRTIPSRDRRTARTTSSCLPGDSCTGMSMVPVKPCGFETQAGRLVGGLAWSHRPAVTNRVESPDAGMKSSDRPG